MAKPSLDHIADVVTCKNRIDALEALLVAYRTGGRPSEELFTKLERTRVHLDRLKERGPWPT